MENYEALRLFFFLLLGKNTDLGLSEAIKWKGHFSRAQQWHWAVQCNIVPR